MNNTNSLAANIIKQFEGCKLTSYLCPAKVWTVGYGHTKTAKPNQRITQDEANQLLEIDMVEAEQQLRKSLQNWDDLSHGQQAALISFVFNLGIGSFNKSTLRKKIIAGLFDECPAEFSKWVKAGGVILKGLVRRRGAEIDLWTGDDD